MTRVRTRVASNKTQNFGKISRADMRTAIFWCAAMVTVLLSAELISVFILG